MPNPLRLAVSVMTEAVRSWLGNWPMSEFPKVFGPGPSSTGMTVTETTALNYAAVWAAVSIVAGDVASLPLVLYKRTPNGGKERYTDSKLFELLHDAPNPEMGSMVFREALQAHVMTWGNGFAEIQRDALGRPTALWPITPDRVTPFREERNRQLRYRVTNAQGAQSILNPQDILHVPGLGFDGVTGYSVVNQARESIGLGMATERFGATFFGNGSTFGGVLSHPQNLTADVKQGIRESIEAVHTGVDRAHKFVILGGGMKYEKLGIPPNDAQFLETRKFQINEVARWFQIPPHKLGDLERATFSNIEQQDIEYYRSCLRRWLVRWEQEINRKLIPPLERKQQFAKHNVEGFLRGDSTARAAFYTSMFNIGAYSINMILESEDLNKIGSEGDAHFVAMNLQPAEFAIEGPPAPAAPPGQPPPPDNPADDTQQQNSLRFAEIVAKTTAIEAALLAQRDALSQEELEKHALTVARLTDEREVLQRSFDDFREQHATDAHTLQAEAAHAKLETETERSARLAADAVAQAAKDAAAADLQAVAAARDDADWRATAAATARATAEAAAVAAAAEVKAALEAAQKAEADAVAARAAQADAVGKQVAADEQRASAERAQAEAAAALAAQHEAEIGRLTGMLGVHRGLIVDAMQRIVAPEVDRARKHQATAEKLRAWVESFYVTYEDRCFDVLRPAIRAHLTWTLSAADIDAVTQGLVREHIAESQRQLRAVVDGEPDELHENLERMLQRWEQDRPTAAADRILKEEIDHVRTLR